MNNYVKLTITHGFLNKHLTEGIKDSVRGGDTIVNLSFKIFKKGKIS